MRRGSALTSGSKDWSEYKVVHPQKAKMSSSLEVELGSMQDGARLGATIEFDEHQDRNSADQFSKLGAWMDNNGADILTNDDFFDDLAFGSNNESPNTKPVAAPTAKPSSKLPMSSRRK